MPKVIIKETKEALKKQIKLLQREVVKRERDSFIMSMLRDHTRLTGSPERKIIASNEAKCKACGDQIFSASAHDYKNCKCGKISVDGGQEYFHFGFPAHPMEDHLEDKSFSVTIEQVNACIDAVNWGITNYRNQYGIALAVLRACRDTGLLKGF